MSESKVKLGELITDDQERDAVHVAVAPAIAAAELKPGQHVGFEPETGTASPDEKHVGIVDPFLLKSVERNQRFWLFLYPNTITSLRHDWTHPAFVTVNDKSESQKWIENFALRIDQTFNRVMEAAADWVQSGDYTYDNSESYKVDYYYDNIAEFWTHYEKLTGTKVEDKSATFFTCSC